MKSLVFLIFTVGIGFSSLIAVGEPLTNPVLHVNLVAPEGKEYNLKLVKPEIGVLHPNIKYITAEIDPKSGRKVFHVWSPTDDEVRHAENVHIDHENRAVLRVAKDENGRRVLDGLVDGMRFQEYDGISNFTNLNKKARRDYIDTNVHLTYNNLKTLNADNTESEDYIVEVAIVCDKEWSDLFQHDRQKILNFWTVHFWDISMRYKTLPSSKISFRITSITAIASIQAQPFIEQARNEEQKADLGRILDGFREWVWGQITFPKFDMAICVTNTELEWYGGLAYLRGTCRNDTGTIVYDDDGAYNSVDAAAHEIGHNLGAPHDADEDYPGGCSSEGFIMSGNDDQKRFFFSECSDRTIKDYVTSDQASCLKQTDESSDPVIQPDFGSVQTPTMDEQCKAWMKSENATVKEEDTGNCTFFLCWDGELAYYMRPIDNTPCLYGRCFRGQCLPNEMSTLRNAESGQCVLGSNRFLGKDIAIIDNCPNVATPLETFHLMGMQKGYYLMMPYSKQEGTNIWDKCLRGADSDNATLTFYECFDDNEYLYPSEWRFDELDVGLYSIWDYDTKMCLKQNGSELISVLDCHQDDPSQQWRFNKII